MKRENKIESIVNDLDNFTTLESSAIPYQENQPIDLEL